MLRFPVLFALLTAVPLALAKEEFVSLIPNGANVPDTTAVGHTGSGNPDDDNINDFGNAFEDAGFKWTVELCKADTDGDGQTNGQELGDPCCVWSEKDDPRWTDGVSHPGDSTKTSNESLWASINCSAVTTTTEKSASSGNDASTLFSSTSVAVALVACSVALAVVVGNN